MNFDIPTLLWVQKNCCGDSGSGKNKTCKFNIKEGTPMSKACSIQLNVMYHGVKEGTPPCDKREEETDDTK